MNIPLDSRTFDINRQRAQDYLNTRERLYCFDGFAGWDAKYRLKVRVICSRPYQALFMHTMLIRPTHAELDAFGAPDFAGAFPANRLTTGMGSTTSIDLSLEDKELVILGAELCRGDEKKGGLPWQITSRRSERALDASHQRRGEGRRPDIVRV